MRRRRRTSKKNSPIEWMSLRVAHCFVSLCGLWYRLLAYNMQWAIWFTRYLYNIHDTIYIWNSWCACIYMCHQFFFLSSSNYRYIREREKEFYFNKYKTVLKDEENENKCGLPAAAAAAAMAGNRILKSTVSYSIFYSYPTTVFRLHNIHLYILCIKSVKL